MNFRRVGGVLPALLAALLWTACGDIYRPVVIPISTTPPNPANFHAAFSINSNGSYSPANATFSFGFGTTFQIDVAGDSNMGQGNVGINPTHAAILPNNNRVFVTSAGSIEPGGVDIVSAFIPESQFTEGAGLGTFTTFSLPNVVANPDPTQPAFFCQYLPDFVAANQTANVYVANYGVEGAASCNLPSTDSIAVLSTSLNAVTQIVPLPAGSHPVAMAQVSSPAGNKLYVANQGTNSVASFNTVDMTPNTVTGFSGITPAWITARADGQKVYVVTQGDGSLITIDTASDTVTSKLPVGVGANYVFYDPKLARLYVTNPDPVSGALYIFATSYLNNAGQPVDTPKLLATIPIPGAVSVTALLDGSRAYVASYQLQSCTDPVFSASCLVIPLVSVIDTTSNTVSTTLSPLTPVQGSVGPPSTPESIDCMPAIDSAGNIIPYTPAGISIPGVSMTPRFANRFRMTTASSADSTRVYVGVCDAGAVAIIQTQTNTINAGGSSNVDTLITDLPTPFANGFPGTNNLPPTQNPVWLLPGQ
jgi:YVTN family beta-propeller protein